MQIRKNAKIWSVLANDCESPGDFMRAILALRNRTVVSLAKELGTSDTYIRIILSNNNIPGTKACLELATALDIDPYLLNHVCSDYKMKQLIEKK